MDAIRRYLLAFPGALLAATTACALHHAPQRSAAELLANRRYQWLADSTRHFRIHYIAGSPAADSLARLKRDVESAWTTAATFIGRADERPIDVFAVPTIPMVGELAGLKLATNTTALNFWETRVIVSWVSPRGWPGPHEIVHIMAYDAWGPAKEWWLGEGVAVAAGPRNGLELDVYTKCLANAGRFLPLEQIVPALHDPDERTARVAYPEAGSFVRFLIRRYGRDRIARLYGVGASAIPAEYGKSLGALDAEWRRHLDSVETTGTSCPTQ